MQAQFVLSAASEADFPRMGAPEIAMVGRSNVGKSSLINALTKQKIARTSAAAGKTRLANYYHLQPPFANAKALYLVDLPGYGYARGGAESVEAFETLTRAYFSPTPDSNRHIAGVLHLIDARHPDLPQDAAAFEWLLRSQLRLAIVAAKVDKLTQGDRAKTVKALESKYGVRVLPESATNETGLDEIWKVLRQWTEE
jgi:GTP-binding protein